MRYLVEAILNARQALRVVNVTSTHPRSCKNEDPSVRVTLVRCTPMSQGATDAVKIHTNTAHKHACKESDSLPRVDKPPMDHSLAIADLR